MLGWHQELETVLARVAAAKDGDVMSGHFAPDEVVILQLIELLGSQSGENVLSTRPLKGDQRVIVTHVLHFALATAMGFDPIEVLLDIRGVDDGQIARIAHTRDDQIVDETSFGRCEGRVMRSSHRETRHVVGSQSLQELKSSRAFEKELAHVAHVEQPGGVANRKMLGHDGAVVHRHLPAGEIHQSCVELSMYGIKRRSLRRGARHS